MGLYDDKIGYLAPWLAHDLNRYLRENPSVTLAEMTRRTGCSSSAVFKANFTQGLSPTVKFLAKYAQATGKDIHQFFAKAASIVEIQMDDGQPYGEIPEPLFVPRSSKSQTPPEIIAKPRKPKAYMDAKPVVEKWQRDHPGATQSECAKDTGLSLSAVCTHWRRDLKMEKDGCANSHSDPKND